MEAKEVIEEVIKKLEPITDPKILEIQRKAYYDHIDQIQEIIDLYYPPEELLEEKAEELIQRIAPDAEEDEKEKLKEEYRKNYYGREPASKRLGLTDEVLDTVYSIAYNNYNHGRYTQARDIFNLLVIWDESKSDYHFGFAASLHMLKEYVQACEHYSICAALDFYNPIPWFHLADCYMQLKAWEHALVALVRTLQRTKGNEEFSEIQRKAELLFGVVDTRLKEQEAKNEEAKSASG